MNSKTIAGSQKLSVLEKVGYSLGDLAANLVFQTLMTYLAYFYTDIYGLEPKHASVIMLTVGLIAAFGFNPVIGALADRTRSKWGKFRPWILFTAIPLGVIALLAFSTPDFSYKGNNCQFEDAFVWQEKKKIKMIARDMGFFNHEDGILMQSKHGLKWDLPKIAYYGADKYIQQPPPPAYLKKYGRFERPQLLFLNGKPAYLFTASQGGKYMTSSSFIFKIV